MIVLICVMCVLVFLLLFAVLAQGSEISELRRDVKRLDGLLERHWQFTHAQKMGMLRRFSLVRGRLREVEKNANTQSN